MKVAAITAPGRCTLVDRPEPRAKGEFAVVKVHVAPMCNEYVAYRDQDYRERNRPDSLGHEAAGEVVEVDRSARVKVGDRVVALCGYPCGRCRVCIAGSYGHCPSPLDPRRATDNTTGDCCFAEYTLKQDWLLVPIPQDLSYERASMILCGLGPSFGALKVMGARPCSTLLVAGLGAVGLGAVITGAAFGMQVIGLARNSYRCDLARKLGASATIDAASPDVLQRVLDLTDGRGVDFAIDTAGVPLYQRLLLDCCARKGQVTFLAEGQELSVHVDRDFVQKGLSVRGSLDINLRDVSELFDLIRGAENKIDRYITHRFPLRSIGEAWTLQAAGKCGKVVIHPLQA